MGVGSSKRTRQLEALGASIPEGERFYGLENFGNTCYCNSVLQALYFCRPLRERCVEHSVTEGGHGDDDLLNSLCDLFRMLGAQKKRTGVYAPRHFITRLRRASEVFNNHMHQDAHEFLNFLLNEAAEILEKRAKRERRQALLRQQQERGDDHGEPSADPSSASAAAGEADSSDRSDTALGAAFREYLERHGGSWPEATKLPAAQAQGEGGPSGAGGEPSAGPDADGAAAAPLPKTWIHSIFEGVLSNETRCLCCDRVTTRDESFLDLSLEIAHEATVTQCLRQFSSAEPMRGDNKFFCDSCASLQEAQKRIRLKKLPNVLALHLKRFKYVEQLQRFKKLSYHVPFPLELGMVRRADGTFVCEERHEETRPERRFHLFPVPSLYLPCTFPVPSHEEETTPERRFHLFAVIVHAGSGPHHGHYVALVRSHAHWLCFDDDVVDLIEEEAIAEYFGASSETQAATETAYILFYQTDGESWDDSVDPEGERVGLYGRRQTFPTAATAMASSSLGASSSSGELASITANLDRLSASAASSPGGASAGAITPPRGPPAASPTVGPATVPAARTRPRRLTRDLFRDN